MDEVALLLHLLCICWTCLQFTLSDVREYCFPNSFNVSCGRGSVIVMHSARYGRINKGQCLTSEFSVGCWTDVLYHVDRRCSGRHRCHVPIPDTTLHDLQPCPKDLLAYLEADYSCQKVENRTATSACRYLGDIPVSGQSGTLASIVTSEHEFGSSRCPWLITMPRGQRVKLVLVDFGVIYRLTDAGVVCHVYARFQEPTLSTATTVCGSRTRVRSVYVSETNQVEVTIMNFRMNEEQVYFVVSYEAVGCVDPLVPRSSWLKRSVDTAVISCNYTTQAWHIVCQGSAWFGKVDNCTAVEPGQPATDTFSSKPRDDFHYGLLVAIVTGLILGVVVGVVMLAIVIACHTRRMGNSAVCVRESTYATHLDVLNDGALGPEGKKLFNGPGNNQYEYGHVCGFHPLTLASRDPSSSSPGRRFPAKALSTDSPSAANNSPAVFASPGNVSAQNGSMDHPGFSVEYRLNNCRPLDQVPFSPEFDEKFQSHDDLQWNSTSG